jgi:hypothetical protein
MLNEKRNTILQESTGSLSAIQKQELLYQISDIIDKTHNYLLGNTETTRMASVGILNYIQNNLIIYKSNNTVDEAQSIGNLNTLQKLTPGLSIIRDLLIAHIQLRNATKKTIDNLINAAKQDDYAQFEQLNYTQLVMMASDIINTVLKFSTKPIELLDSLSGLFLCNYQKEISSENIKTVFFATLATEDEKMNNIRKIVELLKILLYPSGIWSIALSKRNFY